MSMSDTEQAQSSEPMITGANGSTEPVSEENGVVEMETESDGKGMCIPHTSIKKKLMYICDNSACYFFY